MKKLLFGYAFPVFISVTIVYFIAFSKPLNELFFQQSSLRQGVDSSFYYCDFGEDPVSTNIFLNSENSNQPILLLGSSELTENSAYQPYTFISSRSNTKVIGIGSAGNQCLSILCQLMAHQEKLKQAQIVFIISPGWFEDRPASGTPSDVFLKYNKESFLEKITTQYRQTEFYNYVAKRIADLYSEFNSPSIPLRILYLNHISSKSPIHKTLSYLPLRVDDFLLHCKKRILHTFREKNLSKKKLNSSNNRLVIPWDSIANQAKLKVIQCSSNNKFGIDNTLFAEHFSGKRGHIRAVSENYNTEEKDFYFLLKYLSYNKVRASFIIQPLNSLYYINIADLSPSIDRIESEIKKEKFPVLNLFTSDTLAYEKGMLTDAMHFSDYGWIKVNKFIIETYKVCN